MTKNDQHAIGLRERKKAKTRAAIQKHALRLFREQGYYATTVEQIAEEAEISPSTFFRYFPTKEDVVYADDYDPLLFEAFQTQPAGLSPIQALRGAMRSVFADISAEEIASFRDRSELIFTVPELRAAFLNNLMQTMQMIAGIVAKRTGRHPEDLNVRTFTGAFQGVLLSALFNWVANPDLDLINVLDEALALLEVGLPL